MFVTFLLVLIALVWLALVALLRSLHQSDPAGNGLTHAYSVLTTLALFGLLASTLIATAVTSQLTAFSKLAALVLVPASCAATLAGIELLRERVASPESWPLVIPLLVPPSIAVVCIGAAWPSLREPVPQLTIDVIGWSVVLAMSVLPWPLFGRRKSILRSRREAYQRERDQATARDRDATFARLRALTHESPLSAWLEFVSGDDELRAAALEGIHRLPRRQADAEAMIAAGDARVLGELRNLALSPTPALCEAALAGLRREAESNRWVPGDEQPFGLKALRLERQFPTLHWLAANGCDCSTAFEAYQTAANSHPQSQERELFLAALARLRL